MHVVRRKDTMVRLLANTEVPLAQILDLAPDAVITVDADQRIILFNRGAARIFGYHADEVLGRPLDVLLPERFITAHRQYIHDFAASADAARPRSMGVQREIIGQRKDGSEFPAEASIVKLIQSDQTTYTIMLRDISERKRVEDALREAEARYRLLVDSVQDYAIFMLDSTGQVASWNSGAERIKGYRANEIVGHYFARFFTDEDQRQGKPEHELQLALTHGRCEDEGWRVRKDGSRFWASVVVTAIRDETGCLRGFAKVTRDITARRNTEEVLQRNVAQLNILYEISRAILAAQSSLAIAEVTLQRIRLLIPCRHANVVVFDRAADELTVLATDGRPVGGWVAGVHLPLDTFGDIEAFSPGIVHMVQDDLNLAEPPAAALALDVAGLSCYAWIPLGDRDALIGALMLATDTPDTFIPADLDVIRQVADQLAVAIQSTRLFEEVRSAQERLQGLSHRLMEVQESERRAIARELHDEIGPALTVVKINLQALQTLHQNAGLESHLDESMEVVERALQQVRNLSLDLRPSLLDDLGLVAALRWYIDRLKLRARLTIRFVAEPADMRLSSVLETACFRVAQEALTNVVRHAQARRVLVELRQRNAELHLIVRDDGIGFDPQETRVRAAYGASVGLLSMQERVLIAGGQLQIESVLGHGTEVSAHFPVLPPSVPVTYDEWRNTP